MRRRSGGDSRAALLVMARSSEVPEQLRRAPFLGRKAIAAGLLTRRQLQSRTWVPMLRDVFVHRDVQQSNAVRARALLLVMPSDAIIAGRTAAWLQGVWRTRPGVPVPLEYARPRDADGRGILGASLSRRVIRLADDEWSDVTEVAGVPVMSPMRTCFDLMRERALVEAVVVADAYARSGQLSLPWLAAYVRSHDRWPGVRVARDACEFASARSRSAGESRLRMVVVLAGFPVPLVNPPVYTGTTPVILCGHPDLVIVVQCPVLGLEYDGAYHNAYEQRQADNRRENRLLTMAGLPLLRYGARSVLYERSLIVAEVSAMTGLRSPWPIRDDDFRRPPPARAW